MSLVIFVASFETIARFPIEHAIAILLIVGIATFILVAAALLTELFDLLLLPLAVAVLQSVLELSSVAATVFPFVLTKALWFT